MKRQTLWTTRFMAMMLLAISLCFIGCGEKESSNPTNPDTPDTPIVPSDSETIPTSGGTVTKGDITISFPNGTFSSDTKVSVTEVTAGKTLGEDEISKFYKLVVPLNTQQSFKVSIKSSETTDVALVAHAPSVSTHDVNQNTDYSDVILSSTYANGTYTAEIPQFDNNGETTNVEVTFGLARIPNKVTGTRAMTRAVDDGDINWTLYWKENKNHPNKQQIASDIDEAIKDAVTIIKALGFKVKNHRIVPIIITSKGLKEGEYGQHRQSFVSDNWNDILLNSSLLFGSNYSKKKLRCSVIHEMFHYFQSAYDNRGCFRKAKFGNARVMRIMEAGGVWIEKLMDKSNYFDGMWKPNIDCVMQSVLDESVAGGSGAISNAQTMGYGSSVILQWFTRDKGDKTILKMYETWRDKDISNFEDWLKKCETATNCQFFNEYSSFVEMLAMGKVIAGTETTDYSGKVTRKNYNVSDFVAKQRKEFDADGKATYALQVLQWGTSTIKVGLQKVSKESVKGKQLTIKQGNNSVFTKAFLYNSETEKVTSLGEIYNDKPMVINDETTLRNMADYNNTVKLYLVSYQGANNHATETSNIEITLGNVEIKTNPETLTFEAEGGSQKVTVVTNLPNFKAKANDSWLKVKTTDAATLQVTADPNTGDARTGTVTLYALNEQNEEVATFDLKVQQKGREKGEYDLSKCKYITIEMTIKAHFTGVWDSDQNDMNIVVKFPENFWITPGYLEDSGHTKTTVNYNGTGAHMECFCENDTTSSSWMGTSRLQRYYKVTLDIDDIASGKITNLTAECNYDDLNTASEALGGNVEHGWSKEKMSASNIPLPGKSGSAKGNKSTGTTINSCTREHKSGWMDYKYSLLSSDDYEIIVTFE